MSTPRLPNPSAIRTGSTRGGQHVSSCRDTTRYKTEESAERGKRGRAGLVPVVCSRCNGWHLVRVAAVAT